MHLLIRCLTLAMCMLLGYASLSPAQYTYTVIADTTTWTYVGPYPAINAAGQVAFYGVKDGETGIWRSDGVTFTPIALESDPAFTPGGFRNDALFSMNATGQVAFWAVEAGETTEGVFASDGLTLTTIVSQPGWGTIIENAATINDAGQVAFAGMIGGQQGLYVGNGGPLTTLVDNTNPLFSATHPIPFNTPPALNDAGAVAYMARQADNTYGLWRTAAGVHTSIATGPGLPSHPALTSLGLVVLLQDTGLAATITQSDGLLATVLIDALAAYTVAGDQHVAVAGGGLAFLAVHSGHEGIFTGSDPLTSAVIVAGQAFGDTRVALDGGALHFSRAGLSATGSVAFWARLADGTIAIVRADPVPLVLDADADTVPDGDDLCPATLIPEPALTALKKGRYALADGDAQFDRGKNAQPSDVWLEDTAGCSCAQIVQQIFATKQERQQPAYKDQRKHGCVRQTIGAWEAYVQLHRLSAAQE